MARGVRLARAPRLRCETISRRSLHQWIGRRIHSIGRAISELGMPDYTNAPAPGNRLLAATIAILATAFLFSRGAAARVRSIGSESPPDASEVVPLYAGSAPGSKNWTWHEVTSTPPLSLFGGRLARAGRIVRDVVHPTLVVFKPPNPKRSTHTAVIIAPGGAFVWLEIDTEGYDVARVLAAKGVTAIVLKYRLKHTPEHGPDQIKNLVKQIATSMFNHGKQEPFRPSFSPARNPAIADGIAAVRYVREHAAQLGVNPDRIGMIGFSAGGAVTIGTILHAGPESRLDFAGLIYGAIQDISWPPMTPPMFLAVASNDTTGAAEGTMHAFETLRAARHSAELHVFESGNHGFGMQLRGLTSDLWIKEFEAWMAANGFCT